MKLTNTLYSVVLAFIAILLTGTANAKTLRVPNQYATIQSAVDASTTGDVIVVSPGLYRESVRINSKGIDIRSDFKGARPTKEDIAGVTISGVGVYSISAEEGSGDISIVGLTVTSGIGGGFGVIGTTGKITLNSVSISGNKGYGVWINSQDESAQEEVVAGVFQEKFSPRSRQNLQARD